MNQFPKVPEGLFISGNICVARIDKTCESLAGRLTSAEVKQ
jgi:hypothetical protein